MTSASNRLLLVAAFAAVYLIWGSTYLAIRIAIESIPPLLMASVRFLVAGCLLYGWGRLSGHSAPGPRELRTGAVVGLLLVVGGNGMVVWAEQWVPSGLTALLVAVEPLMIVLLLWLVWSERPAVGVLVGVAAGFGGVLLLVLPDATGVVVPWGGAAILVFAAGSWALGSLYASRAPRANSALIDLGVSMLAGGGMLLVLSAAAGELLTLRLSSVTWSSILALLYLIAFGTLLAFSAYVWLVRTTPPALASTYAYVNPVVALLLGWALADEPLGPRTVVAAAAIVGAVAIVATHASLNNAGDRSSAPSAAASEARKAA